jgi:hypothetical protein
VTASPETGRGMSGDSATTAEGGRVATSEEDGGWRADGSRGIATGLTQGMQGCRPPPKAGQRETPGMQALYCPAARQTTTIPKRKLEGSGQALPARGEAVSRKAAPYAGQRCSYKLTGANESLQFQQEIGSNRLSPVGPDRPRVPDEADSPRPAATTRTATPPPRQTHLVLVQGRVFRSPQRKRGSGPRLRCGLRKEVRCRRTRSASRPFFGLPTARPISRSPTCSAAAYVNSPSGCACSATAASMPSAPFTTGATQET